MVAALTLTFGACDGPPDRVALPDEPSAYQPPPAPPDPDLAFAATIEDARAKRWQSSFPLGGTRDVVVALRLPESSATTFVRMDVYLAGKGSHYRTVRYAVVKDPTVSEQISHPVDGREMTVLTSEGDRVFLTIPVAGTRMTRHRMAGAYDVLVTFESADPDKQPDLVSSLEMRE